MTDIKNVETKQKTQDYQKPKIGDTKPAEDKPAGKAGNPNGQNSPKRKKSKNQNKNKFSKNKSQENSASKARSSAPRVSSADHKGRYQMLVHSDSSHTHIAVMQGKQLTGYSISRDDYTEEEIYGNIYKGVVKNIYAGTEMAFVDIGTVKNAALHQNDMLTDQDDFDEQSQNRGLSPVDIALRPNQHVLCQVTKNPIAHKGARLTQEINLSGRYAILIPNRPSPLKISKKVPDSEKKRLRRILETVKPKEHGAIVRTEAAKVPDADIIKDFQLLLNLWKEIEESSKKSKAPSLVYRGANNTFRIIRDQFNEDFRSIVVDDGELYDEIADHLENAAPALANRLEFYDSHKEPLDLFEKYNVSSQLQKSLDPRVWLPSGGEIVIERTEAMTVVDVNTAKNTGTNNLEDTALTTNLEAATEIARQLRLHDIGGIIVIDFIDLKDESSKATLMKHLRSAMSEDVSGTRVENVSTFGLVQMTRKRIGESLLDSFSNVCDSCTGTGYNLNLDLMGTGTKTKN